ncbi:MAG: hypothetical protein IJV04_05440 [Lachnospiraceae bacterium]|nr:hypothetical protein [Lachnospiraceae bacterium]
MRQWRRILVFVTMLAVLVAAIPLTTEAASRSNIRRSGVKWGMRAGKSYRFPAYYSGITSTKPVEWVVSKPKIKNAKKNGYKQMSFVISMFNLSDFSQEEVDAICRQDSFGGGVAWYLVDEDNGKSLEAKNKLGVTAKTKVLNESAVDGYETSDGKMTFYPRREYQVGVVMVYPEDYEGMCLLLGTYKDMTEFSTSDSKFFNGKLPLNKTSMFKKSKSCTRGVNLLKL